MPNMRQLNTRTTRASSRPYLQPNTQLIQLVGYSHVRQEIGCKTQSSIISRRYFGPECFKNLKLSLAGSCRAAYSFCWRFICFTLCLDYVWLHLMIWRCIPSTPRIFKKFYTKKMNINQHFGRNQKKSSCKQASFFSFQKKNFNSNPSFCVIRVEMFNWFCKYLPVLFRKQFICSR